MTKGPIKQLQTIMDPVDLGACAKLGQFGWAQMRNAQNDWVEGALTTAKALHTARLSFSNDTDFGKWCEANRLGFAFINHNDRAALIRIGADLDYWRDRIAKSDSRSLPRIVANDIPPPEVSPARIPARHQTKPGPKPKPATKPTIGRGDPNRAWPKLSEAAHAIGQRLIAIVPVRRSVTDQWSGDDRKAFDRLMRDPQQALEPIGRSKRCSNTSRPNWRRGREPPLSSLLLTTPRRSPLSPHRARRLTMRMTTRSSQRWT